MASPSRTLEITAISAENLRINRKPVKKNTFVIVRMDSDQSFCTTKMDEQGGSYPSWSEKLVMELSVHARFITVEVHCRTSVGNYRIVGSVVVPVSDFVEGYVTENYLHFLSYRLRDDKGEKNGIVNISMRVKASLDQYECTASTSRPPEVGVPVMAGRENYNFGAGVVTGVPVLFAYPTRSRV